MWSASAMLPASACRRPSSSATIRPSWMALTIVVLVRSRYAIMLPAIRRGFEHARQLVVAGDLRPHLLGHGHPLRGHGVVAGVRRLVVGLMAQPVERGQGECGLGLPAGSPDVPLVGAA